MNRINQFSNADRNLALPKYFFPIFSTMLLIIGVFPLQGFAQSSCQKEISYRIFEQTSHAVSNELDFSTLNTMDLLKGKEELKVYTVNVCIDEQGYVTTTKDITYQENTFYPNPIAKIVHGPHSAVAYDKDGNEVHHTTPAATDVSIPGLDAPLDESAIAAYGTNIDFSKIVTGLQSHFQGQGGQHWNVGSKQFFSNDQLDVVIAPEEQYQIFNIYDEQDQLSRSHLSTYRRVDEFQIPEFEVVKSFSNFSTGDKMQTTVFQTYIDYEVVENGQALFAYHQKEHPSYEKLASRAEGKKTNFAAFQMPMRIRPQLEINPNPANDILNVDFKSLWDGKSVLIELIRTDQRIVKSWKHTPGEVNLIVDVSDMAGGMYFLRVTQGSNQLIEKVIISK